MGYSLIENYNKAVNGEKSFCSMLSEPPYTRPVRTFSEEKSRGVRGALRQFIWRSRLLDYMYPIC